MHRPAAWLATRFSAAAARLARATLHPTRTQVWRLRLVTRTPWQHTMRRGTPPRNRPALRRRHCLLAVAAAQWRTLLPQWRRERGRSLLRRDITPAQLCVLQMEALS